MEAYSPCRSNEQPGHIPPLGALWKFVSALREESLQVLQHKQHFENALQQEAEIRPELRKRALHMEFL